MDSSDSFERLPCPLCGNTDLEQVSRRGQFGLPCFVSLCPRDGLVFLSPRWSKARYDRFYAREYDTYYRGNIFGHVPSRNRFENIETICSRLDDLGVSGNWTSVLDVGSGMGWSLDHLKRTYPSIRTIAAIESSEHCLEHLDRVIGAEIVAHDIDSQWHRDHAGRFDLVVMRHVLEHFLDPVAALGKVRDSLARDGMVYLAVPDMMHPRGSLYDYWFRVVHTFYFSGETLKRIAGTAGLAPVAVHGEGAELWGVFVKAGSDAAPGGSVNVYAQQARVLRRRKLLEPYFRLRNRVRPLLARLVPRAVRNKL